MASNTYGIKLNNLKCDWETAQLPAKKGKELRKKYIKKKKKNSQYNRNLLSLCLKLRFQKEKKIPHNSLGKYQN